MNEYDVYINGVHDGKALRMILCGNSIKFDGYIPDKPIFDEQTMTNDEKARIILENMDKNGVQVFWPMENVWLKGIVAGLEEIEKRENR